MDLIKEEKKLIDEEFKPGGYNIGVNVGSAAGQSIFHVHIHIIPRYEGDVRNPQRVCGMCYRKRRITRASNV